MLRGSGAFPFMEAGLLLLEIPSEKPLPWRSVILADAPGRAEDSPSAPEYDAWGVGTS